MVKDYNRKTDHLSRGKMADHAPLGVNPRFPPAVERGHLHLDHPEDRRFSGHAEVSLRRQPESEEQNEGGGQFLLDTTVHEL